MRRKYVYDPSKKTLVEVAKSEGSSRLFIYGDIKPYVAVAGDMAGKEITSRSQHRAFLKRNGFEEVGNELPYMERKRKEFIADEERKAASARYATIKRVMSQYGLGD